MPFDAVLLLSFGGPDGPADVIPFLENVTRGRPVPPERLQAVAARYHELGGTSPINALNRDLVARLSAAQPLPVYWGNRNWHPFVSDTVKQMAADGVRRAACFATSAYASYSGCRQYLDDIARARSETAGAGLEAPEIVKVPPFFDQPGFVGPLADGLRAARAETGPGAAVLMSAHSIPAAMAATCDYEKQLVAAAGTIGDLAGVEDWSLVYQSRSGPPSVPWLEPDVNDAITALPPSIESVIVVPIGFVSDHMEVIYDLDHQAAATAAARGLRFVRTPTPGTDPRFVAMICDLVDRLHELPPCAPGCCAASARSGPRR